MVCSFWCSLQRLSSGLSSQTSLFSKAKLHLYSNTPRRNSHCPHLLTHYFTAPSSANPRRRVTVTQCFTHQPLTSFSASLHKSRRYSLHFNCLYVWFVCNSKVFRIFYIESRIGRSYLLLYFIFFPFFSLFDVWVFASNVWWYLVMKVCESAFFCLFDVWVSILFDLLKPMVMGFQPCRTYASLFAVFSFFSLFDVWVSIWFDLLDSHGYGFILFYF